MHKKLTVIIVVFNMRREAPRTLFALTPRYQLDVLSSDYEVLVIDHGSSMPLEPAQLASLEGNVRYCYVETRSVAPCQAINQAVQQASTPYVAIMVDGARVPSPGCLRGMLEAGALCADPFVYTLGMHLGRQIQNKAMLEGYNQQVEDRLLDTVPWQADGYRLFDIAVPGGSYRNGYAGPISESNFFCLRRDSFLELGGYDERFVSAGGGLANLDFFNRANQRAGMTPILLLGEATFHQFHGGAATNAPASQSPWPRMVAEYEALKGAPYRNVWRKPLLLGRPRPENAALFSPLPIPRLNTSWLMVLGMHRSGTSCLAGMLQGSGFATGVMAAWRSDNQRGNREDLAVVKLNDAILNAHGAAWHRPPQQELVLVNEEHRLARAEVLGRAVSSDRPWMFKDPRTLLILPFWREALPNPRRIGIFRHPWRVAMSLYFRREGQQSIEEGLALWIAYNKALLAEYERAPFPLVCFDSPRDDFIGQVAEALRQECPEFVEQQVLNLDRLGDFYDAALIHQQEMPAAQIAASSQMHSELLDEAEAIYRQLCELARIDVSKLPATDGGRLSGLVGLQSADEAARAGQMEHALSQYRALLATATDPALIWRRMIQVRLERREDALARQLCQEAAASCPEDSGLWVQLADLSHKDRQTQEALQAIDIAIGLRPDWGLPYLKRGVFLNALARWQESVSAFGKAFALQNLESSWFFVPYSIALLRTGSHAKAEEIFQIAVERNPPSTRPIIHHQWALALAAIGDCERALEYHELALSFGGNQPSMFVDHAKLLRSMGRAAEAERILRRAIEQGLDGPPIRALLEELGAEPLKRA